MIPDLGVIIAAGGSSQRYGCRDKLMEKLGGIPIFLHSICNFMPLVAPGNLVVAVRSEVLELYRRTADDFLSDNRIVWVAGGGDRVASVRNALDVLPLEEGIVAIHDAARPLADKSLLEKVVARARICGGAIASGKVADSLKLADDSGRIISPVSRDMVYYAETPQAFDLNSYRKAVAALDTDCVPTDDAEIMRLAGFPVELVESGQWNMKLTSPDDLEKLRILFREK